LLTLANMATTTFSASTKENVRQSHPRLIPVERLRERVQPVGWTRTDTLFVLMLLAAVAVCAFVPFALL